MADRHVGHCRSCFECFDSLAVLIGHETCGGLVRPSCFRLSGFRAFAHPLGFRVSRTAIVA